MGREYRSSIDEPGNIVGISQVCCRDVESKKRVAVERSPIVPGGGFATPSLKSSAVTKMSAMAGGEARNMGGGSP